MAEDKAGTNGKKKRVSQTDVPAYSLEHALRVPTAIADNYASEPCKPLEVAVALNVSPTSGPFKMLTGASIAYGLTVGGYNASEIELTPLAKRILSPLEEGDDLSAKREALLRPRIVGMFLNKYDGNPIPKDNIAENVLIDMGVPKERSADVLSLIIESANGLGLIQEIKNKKYVNLSKPRTPSVDPLVEPIYNEDEDEDKAFDRPNNNDTASQVKEIIETVQHSEDVRKNKKVFITHGKNKEFVEPIKKLLSFGELEAVVSVEKQSVSQPVPDKVMNDMRDCGAAIIHVEGELTLLDKDAKEHVVLNPNVLIEIGAAMALYGKRFILLVKQGVKLPSNLQGLYEVRYEGEALDGNATIKLLEAINELKKSAK